MKKKALKTTFFLLLISGAAKVLSFLIRILTARLLNQEALNYYSLTMPVLMFLIALSNFGIPNALTKLVASKKESRASISASIILSLINNLFLLLVSILGIPLYAKIVMKQEILIPVLYACVPMLPFVMATGLLKGYFSGRHQLLLSYSSQMTEELFRLIFLVMFYPHFSHSPVLMAAFAVFSQTIGEIGSLLHLSLSLIIQKGSSITSFLHVSVPFEAFQELLSLSVPMTASRMIGSLTAFLEPVFMVQFASELMQKSYVDIYAQMNTYILPLITLPGFFSVVISSWVLPAFSNAYERSRQQAKTIFVFSAFLCLIIGCSCSLIYYFFSTEVCHLLYHATKMASLLKLLSLPFSIYAMQPVLSCILHGASKSTRALFDTCAGCLLRLISMILFVKHSFIHAAAYSLIISSLVTTMLHLHGCISLFFNHD